MFYLNPIDYLQENEKSKDNLISSSIPILRIMVLQNCGADASCAYLEKGNQSKERMGL